MSPRRALGTLLVLAVGGLGLAVTPAVVPAAQAVTGSPPVTTPDSGTVFQGNIADLQPINNDHDPDNDQLALCRLGTEHYTGLRASSSRTTGRSSPSAGRSRAPTRSPTTPATSAT